MWMRQELNETILPNQIDGHAIPHSFLVEYEFNCETHQNRTLFSVIYSEHAGRGGMLSKEDPDGEWSDDQGSYLTMERQACTSDSSFVEPTPLPAPDPPELTPAWSYLPPQTKVSEVAAMFGLLDNLQQTGWLDRLGAESSLENGFHVSDQQAGRVVEAWKATFGHGSAQRRATEALARWAT